MFQELLGRFAGSGGTFDQADLPQDLRGKPNYIRTPSESLLKDVRAMKNNWDSVQDRVLDESQIGMMRKQILAKLEKLENPYHARLHTEQVVQCFEILCSHTNIVKNDRLLGISAAITHDDGHCGSTYRQLTSGRNVAGTNLSNEEFAFLTTDRDYGYLFSVRQRLILQGLHLSTSFGQSKHAKLPAAPKGVVLMREYAPETKLEVLLAFADISRFMLGADKHMDGSLKLLEESGNKPECFEKWLEGEKGFFSYIQGQTAVITSMISKDGASFLQDKLAELQKAFDYIEAGSQDNASGFRAEYDKVVARQAAQKPRM